MKLHPIEFLKAHPLRRRTLVFLIVNGALALLALICLLVCLSLRGKLLSQRAAERFAGDSELSFAQLSAFMSEDDTLTLGNIYAFRQALLDRMTEASVEAPEGGRLYIDAWSAFGKTNVAGDHGNADVNVVAVGGDWFFFHPLRVKTGSYIWEDDVMDDRVVLDRDLAWRLFGGDDLTGLTVSIGGQPFVIAGVVERDTDFASNAARAEGNILYMSYTAWNRLSEDAEKPIDCYELVMPQPVKGFADSFVKEKFPLGGGETVNNSSRFSMSGIWSVVREFGKRSMHRSSVIFPEWENAARCLGDWCGLFLALAGLFVVSPAVSAFIALMVGLIRMKDHLAKTVPVFVSDAVDRARAKRWEELHKED